MDLKKIKHQIDVNEGDIENLWYMVEFLSEKVEELETNIKSSNLKQEDKNLKELNDCSISLMKRICR